MADWACAEQREKIRAETRIQIFGHARVTFVLLFFVAVWVFFSNHQMQVQRIASAEMHKAANKVTLPDTLQRQALDYEKKVDQINQ
jgi:hypothetical protein